MDGLYLEAVLAIGINGSGSLYLEDFRRPTNVEERVLLVVGLAVCSWDVAPNWLYL